jgi:hypothetical protein
MVNWKYQLDLKDIWEWFETVDKENPEIVQEGGKKVADRIVAAPFFKRYEYELEDIAQDFRDAETINEFDRVLNELYNWADVDNFCWIKTF